MKNLIPVLRIAFSLLIVSAAVGVFFLLGRNETETRKPDRSALPNVETVIALDHQGGIQFDVDGLVVPFRQITLAAQVSGRILSKSPQCQIGRVVKAGDLLVTIDPKDSALEIRRLKEELRQADASIGELDAELNSVENQIVAAREELKIEQRQLSRIVSLLDRRAGSETEADAARRAELMTRKTLQTLLDEEQLIQRRRIRLESAKALGQANLERAELELSRTQIRSPIDAIVVADNVEQDGYVQVGTAVVTLQESDRLDVTCKLLAKQMNWLWQADTSASTGSMSDSGIDATNASQQPEQQPKQQLARGFANGEDEVSAYRFPETPVTVSYELGGVRYQWDGVMDRYDGAGLDPQTRMIPCRVLVQDPDQVSVMTSGAAASASGQQSQPPPSLVSQPPTLMTGMFVKVVVVAKPPIPLVRIPSPAVGPGGVVWTVNDGKLQKKYVSIATTNNNEVIAYQQPGGLTAGDAIVVSPIASPVDGLQVREIPRSVTSVAVKP